MEHVPDFLGALVGDLDANVIFVGCERRLQPRALSIGEAFASGAQEVADAVERVAPASKVS